MPEALKPKTILLLTDLSARSDRALDRAVQLARQWSASLIVAHALNKQADWSASIYDGLPSWRQPPNPVLAVEKQIRREIREDVSKLKIVVTEGNAADIALDIVHKENCDLIILGAGGDPTFGQIYLGKIATALIQRASTSVLIVKSRPSGEYRNILVGIDFTEESRHGLSVATKLFPQADFTVMHSIDIPYRTLLSDTQLSRDFSAMELDEIRDFVKSAEIADEIRSRVSTLVEHGPPELMMRKFVTERNADLTVIGTITHGKLFHLLIGGNAPRIVDASPSDILIAKSV